MKHLLVYQTKQLRTKTEFFDSIEDMSQRYSDLNLRGFKPRMYNYAGGFHESNWKKKKGK